MFELVLLQLLVVAEKLGTRLELVVTLHATWPFTLGLLPAMKVQVSPLLHGRLPLTG